MSELPLRVVKIGGSLLDLPDIGQRLMRWLDQQSAAVNVLVVGGGPLVDVIRTASKVHRLNDEAAHWLSIRAMTVNAHLMAALLPREVPVLGMESMLVRRRELTLALLDAWAFVRDEDACLSKVPLPCSWDVTSDSIAARLAGLSAASDLALLKSSLPEGATDFDALATIGYVDRYFPAAAESLQAIRCVNLRNARFGGWQSYDVCFASPTPSVTRGQSGSESRNNLP